MTLALLELQFSRDLTRWLKSKCKSLINLDKDLNLNAYFVCIIHRKSINFLSTGSSFSFKETFIFVCNLSYPFIQSKCLIKIYLTKNQVLYRDLLSTIWISSRMQSTLIFFILNAEKSILKTSLVTNTVKPIKTICALKATCKTGLCS